MLMQAIATSFIAVALAVSGQVLWKLSIKEIGWQLLTNVGFMVGVMLYGLSTLVYIYAVSRFPLSYIYPFMGMTFIIMLIPSRMILHEEIDAWRICGALLIGLGIVISSFGRH